ncbi:GTP-binding protein [Arthrobacter sp. H41]|uniref:GTP-binding protein n=1 Tax=Arthrobacter sp. H41 TaxID=1312978 RepID=UPI0020A6B512|nr:GTP-binding protein [Arthrobacter sp. H41]
MEARCDWHPVFGDRGTVLAATGEGMDPAEINRLLTSCELTDAEMMAGHDSFTDPFDLSPIH